MYTFASQDHKEQFEEKVRLMAEEELKRIKEKEFMDKIRYRIEHYRPFQPEIVIDDNDYQMDVDTELSLINQGEEKYEVPNF